MRILSWNLNGLRACLKNGSFERLKTLPLIDVFCFQEIRTREQLRVLDGYHHFWYPAEKMKYSGTLTLTLIKPEKVIYGMGIPELDKEGRVLTVDMGNVYVVNTYVPNSQKDDERREYRLKWDIAYHSFIKNLSDIKPVIACGDFNVTMSRKDIYKENGRMDWAENGYASDERSNLLSVIDDGFIDAYRHLYPDEENAFTWWSNRLCKRKENRGWRLDYFIVVELLKEHIQDVIHHQEITGSDHCPIVLDCVIEDDVYDAAYKRASTEKKERERKERELAQKWSNRQKHFKSYEQKLAEIQAEISIYTQMHKNSKVHELQMRIMDDIRFKCLAVNKVSQVGAPPGVDNIKWKTNAEKMGAVLDLDWRDYQALPKRIIEIKSKNTGKIRRTGILAYRDKAMSVLCGYTFSPVEEAYADRSSFAFRPNRSRQDAVVAVANLFMGINPPEKYVYLDIRGFYATLQHKWIMEHVPIVKDVLRAFLKSGHIFAGELFPSGEEGISEGSPLSPMIANFTLDGMQKAIYDALYGKGQIIDYANGAMVRYADDVVVAVRTTEDADVVIATVQKFLEPRGLVISEEKTKTGSIHDGFTIIGFEIKKEDYGVDIKPGVKAVERFKSGMHDYILSFTRSQRDLIEGINKKMMGWAGQYRFCNAYDSYRDIDAAVHTSLLEAAIRHHPKMQIKKLIGQYWYTDSKGVSWYSLQKDRSVRIIHLVDTLLVAPRRSRTDVNSYYQSSYFLEKKGKDDIERVNAKFRPIWERQNGKCFFCGNPLLPDQPKDIVMVDHTKADTLANSAYVHTICIQSDYQFLFSVEDVGGMTEYDVYDTLKRIDEEGTVVRSPLIPDDWKYLKLYNYFGECTKKKILLSFKDMEKILGFKLTDAVKSNRTQWYPRKDMHMMADAWILQGYNLKRLYIAKQKVLFESIYEDAEHVVIPSEILEKKIPKNAKLEIEHFLNAIVKKYGLSDEEIIYRKSK